MRAYGRRKRPGSGEPNDRSFDHLVAWRIKRLPPEQLDELMHGGSERDCAGEASDEQPE